LVKTPCAPRVIPTGLVGNSAAGDMARKERSDRGHVLLQKHPLFMIFPLDISYQT
jgi:hypothetical protein